MTRFSPSDAALEGFRLTREWPGAILTWCFIYFGGLFLIAIAMFATLGPRFIEMARKGQLLTAQQDSEQLSELLADSWPAFIIVLLMTVLLMSMIMGGIFRLVLRPAEKGFVHLRLGKDELRLAAVNLVLVLVGAVFLVVGIVVTQLAAGGGGAAYLAGALFLGVTLWIGVRLSLVTPLTFDQGRIDFAGAWRMTRGRFWPLLGMVVLAVIFYLIVWILMSLLSFALVELTGGDRVMQDIGQLTPATAAAAAISLVMQLLMNILQIVMIYAPFAVAYRQYSAVETTA